ncbi:MAG: hypothetical protein N2593_02580 [Patescibacteria group bacterium]|nr:hypothetical protein [Patescibacteria group bacterium]
MIENKSIIESLTYLIPLSSYGLFFLGMAFSSSQKKAIKERDKNICQFPDPHNCCGGLDRSIKERNLHVHHIIPQRYAKYLDIDPDFLENGITLCRNAHMIIHPDMKQIRNKREFFNVINEREGKLKKGEIYWNSTWDSLFHDIVLRNSQKLNKSTENKD